MTNQKSPVRAIEISPAMADNKSMNKQDPWSYTPADPAELARIREVAIRASFTTIRRAYGK